MIGPRFHRLLIVDEMNAAAVKRQLLGMFCLPRNSLLLGLPLLEALSPQQALAVVAHELLKAELPWQVVARSPQDCDCFDVSRSAIVDALATCSGDAHARLAQRQQRLSCGTQCGSCVPAARTGGATRQARGCNPCHSP